MPSPTNSRPRRLSQASVPPRIRTIIVTVSPQSARAIYSGDLRMLVRKEFSATPKLTRVLIHETGEGGRITGECCVSALGRMSADQIGTVYPCQTETFRAELAENLSDGRDAMVVHLQRPFRYDTPVSAAALGVSEPCNCDEVPEHLLNLPLPA